MNRLLRTRSLLKEVTHISSRNLGFSSKSLPKSLTKFHLEARHSKFHTLSRQFSKPSIPVEPIFAPLPDSIASNLSQVTESRSYEKEEGQRQIFSSSAPDDKPNDGSDPQDSNSRTRGRRSRKTKDKKVNGEYVPSIPSDFMQLRYKSSDDNQADFSSMLYPVSESVKQEVVLSIQAALIPSPQDSSAQGRRSNILLECSAPGASAYLDGLVECSAKELGADILSFDIHDLMIMTTDMFSRTNVNPWPIFPNNSMMPSFPGSPYVSSDSYGQDDDDDDDMDDEDEGWQDNGKPGVLVMGQGEPFGSVGEAYKQKMEEKFDRFFTSLLSRSNNSLDETKPLIVYFKDFSQLGNSRFSVTVLKSLMEVTQKERQKGRRIVVVGGVTPSLLNPASDAKHQLVQDISSVVMQLVERASYIPNFYQISIPTPEVVKNLGNEANTEEDKKWNQVLQENREKSIHEMNVKNIISLCIRKGAPVNYYNYQNFGENLRNLDGIFEEVWSFEKVHRLTTIAIGSASRDHQGTDASNVQLEFGHFQKALEVVNNNLALRPDVLASRIQKEAEEKDPLSRKNVSRDDCNSYEKKMLSCVVDAQSINSGFSDICTNPSTIQTLQTLITLPLLRPHLFARGVLARHYISGMLLFGPPGTGKTLLAKAVAKESGSNVLEIKGSDVYNKYVGEGEKSVKAIFSLARKLSPCVVFIDEVDALFSSRRSDSNGSGKREIINQFMVEWDGLTSKNSGVIVMAATNRPFDLDDAVLRRMPRRILVDLPQQNERENILKLHLREEALDSSVDLSKIAQQTALYSGSDLKNVCISAALNAVKETITKELNIHHPVDPTKPLDLSLLNKSGAVQEGNRPLSQTDFDNALLQVAPSCSDEMQSVLELRKWDKTYGDGAKARNKKSGYGFGITEAPSAPIQ